MVGIMREQKTEMVGTANTWSDAMVGRFRAVVGNLINVLGLKHLPSSSGAPSSTAADRIQELPIIASTHGCLSAHLNEVCATRDIKSADRTNLNANEVASRFVLWLREFRLAKEWTVDEVWFLAEADFSEANDISLPPRRVFLGALKKQPGIRVVQDRRIYNRAGRVLRKTTFYDFSSCLCSTSETDEPDRLAA